MAMDEPSNHLSDQLEAEQLNHEDPESKPPTKPKQDTKSLLQAVRSGVRQSSAISALLASAAAQLYGIFKSPDFYKDGAGEGPKDTILALCYTSLILNIGASIAGFVIADVGEVHAHAGTQSDWPRPVRPRHKRDQSGGIPKTFDSAILRYQRSPDPFAVFDALRLYWAVSFFGGIVSLLLMIFVYVLSQEKNALKIYVSILSFYVLLIPLLELVSGLAPFFTKRVDSHDDRTAAGSLKAQSATGGITSVPANNRSEDTLPQMSPTPNVAPMEASSSPTGSLPGGTWRAQDHRSSIHESMV